MRKLLVGDVCYDVVRKPDITEVIRGRTLTFILVKSWHS